MANDLRTMDLHNFHEARRTLLHEGHPPSGMRLSAADLKRFNLDPFEGSILGMICDTAKPITAQEQFCIALSNTPLLAGDALIFLCGEDTAPRLKMLHEIMRTDGARHVIATGGLHTPPQRIGAGELMGDLMAVGVSFNHLTLEPTALNTREQAMIVVPMLLEKQYKRVLLLVPSYHQFRAYLTFLQALIQFDAADKIHVVIASSGHVPWSGKPEGMDVTRLELLGGELAKIAEYRAQGHCATYEQGIDYLRAWEGK